MKRFKPLALMLALAILALGRQADAALLTYDFHLTAPNGTPVTDLVLYAANASQDDVFLSPVVLPVSGVFQLTHAVGFQPTEALVLGISKRTTEEKWDVIMFTTNAYAASAVGLRFGDLFPNDRNPRHSELTLLLQGAHDGDTASLNAVTDFLRGPDAAAAYFNPYGSFSIIQYSTVEPPIGGSTVPEPSTLALWSIGAMGLGLVARRRGKPRQPAR